MGRTEQVKTERRRRNSDSLSGKRRRLAIDESKLDRENYEYFLAKDTGSRVYDLTVNDDWDVVSDRSGKDNDGSGTGSEVAVHAGAGERHVLLRKPKHFADEDKARAQRRIDDQEAALKNGVVPGGDMSGSYVPDGQKAPMSVTVDQSAAPQVARS